MSCSSDMKQVEPIIQGFAVCWFACWERWFPCKEKPLQNYQPKLQIKWNASLPQTPVSLHSTDFWLLFFFVKGNYASHQNLPLSSALRAISTCLFLGVPVVKFGFKQRFVFVFWGFKTTRQVCQITSRDKLSHALGGFSLCSDCVSVDRKST